MVLSKDYLNKDDYFPFEYTIFSYFKFLMSMYEKMLHIMHFRNFLTTLSTKYKNLVLHQLLKMKIL